MVRKTGAKSIGSNLGPASGSDFTKVRFWNTLKMDAVRVRIVPGGRLSTAAFRGLLDREANYATKSEVPSNSALCHTEMCLRGRATAGGTGKPGNREESPVFIGRHAG
jgi:hypothetical protein